MNNFLFVAAENDGIAHCKAGGMGDVVRDVPREISRRGDRVHVVVPSYSRLHATWEICHGSRFFSSRYRIYGSTL